MIAISKMTTEYRENPIGLQTTAPRFSWEFDLSSDEAQTAYRIVVMKAGKKVVWDSGVINSTQNLNVEYKGAPIESMQDYTVDVTVLSATKSTNVNGTFETGLLYESDWKGIWSGTNANFTDRTTIVRREFEIKNKPVRRARAYVLAIGYHELFFNREKVGDRYLAPSNSDPTKSLYYVTYDLNDFVKIGEHNAIALEIGYGWFGRKTFMVETLIEYEDGERERMRSGLDGQWWIGGGATLRNSVFDGETKDLIQKKALGDWKGVGYEPNWNLGWMYAFHQVKEVGVKRSDLADPIRKTEEFKPINVTEVNGEFVFDFGQNMSGWVKLVVSGEKGTKVSMRFAEIMRDDGQIEQLNLRTARQLDEVILAGDEEEVFEPRFTYHGFRFMQVKIEGKATIKSATAYHVHNDVKITGYFECSDSDLNKLHKNVVMTELNNMHSIMTDCPQRDERIGWLNDLSSRIFQTVNNVDLSRMIPKLLQDFEDTQDPDGSIADCAPFFAGDRPADPICASYLLFGYKAYQYYGDKRVLSERFAGFEKWVNYLMGRCDDDLVLNLSYYGDWVVPDCYIPSKTDGAYMSTTYLYWQLCLLSYMAKILGDKKRTKKYAKIAGKYYNAINEKWFDKKTKNYANGSQCANSIAVSLGLCKPEYVEDVIKNIVDDCIAKGKHSTSGNQGYRHFFYVLAQAGYTQLLIEVLKNRDYPGWGHMLEEDGTTIWERWETEIKLEMHSFDHPMFGSFDGLFYHYLGGIVIDDDACGCDKITINPHFNNDLTFVKAHMDTVRGRIATAWEKKDGVVVLKLRVPHTVTAKLDFVGKINGVAFEKGKLVGGGEYEIEIEA